MLYEDRVFIILYQSVFALPYCSAAVLHHGVVAPRFYSRSASFSDSLITPKKAHPAGIYAVLCKAQDCLEERSPPLTQSINNRHKDVFFFHFLIR